MAHTGLLPLDLAISFDTTASMGSVINQVRTNIAEMLERLSADIPDLRVAVIAHGDYGDKYETEIRDFGTSTADLVKFVKTVSMTGGSDEPECYELVLQQARTHLTWRQSSTRVLVLVGDAFPHEVGSARNKYGIDWKAEVRLLCQLGVTAYCVQCRKSDSITKFMTYVANATGGLRLPLAEFRGVRDFLMSIAYREGGTEALQGVYEQEVRAREGAALSSDVSAMLKVVRRTSATTASTSSAVTIATKTVSTKTKMPSRSTKVAKAAVKVAAIGASKKSPLSGTKMPKTKTAKKSLAARVRREICSSKKLPSSLASLAWSPWRLIGQPGGQGQSRLSWKPFGSGSVRRSLLSARSNSSAGQQALELAVQPRPGARRFPMFGRVLSIGGAQRRCRLPVTIGRLLSGRPSVRAQLLRVLSQGMRVFARVAPTGRMPRRSNLMKSASYAWSTARSVRCSGVFVSVSERSLG